VPLDAGTSALRSGRERQAPGLAQACGGAIVARLVGAAREAEVARQLASQGVARSKAGRAAGADHLGHQHVRALVSSSERRLVGRQAAVTRRSSTGAVEVTG
jgi:hypothetical protein